MIFVIDCAAPEKLQDSAEAVVEVMSIGTLSGLPLVVFCNKCDRRGDEKGTETLSLEEVEAALNLKRGNLGTLMGVYDTSSFESDGIEAALDSLVQKLVEQHKQRRRRPQQQPRVMEERPFHMEQRIMEQELELELG